MALASAFSSGCGTDETILLEAKIEAPSLTVTAAVLTTSIEGSFDMKLSLGQYASDPTTVKLGTFSLKRGDAVLMNPLDLTTDPPFPLTVGVGTSKRVNVTFEDPPGQPPELAEALCAGELQIAGTLTDSLGDDRPRSVTSLSFAPDCP